MTACLLSLFMSGLGQVYNGNGALGVVFALARALPLYLLPAVWLIRNNELHISTFFVLSAAAVVFTASSAVEAAVTAAHGNELPVKSYNRVGWYLVFAVFSSAVSSAGLIASVSVFSCGRVASDTAGPLLLKGDAVLISRPANGPRRGDAVWLSGGKVARVIALEGDQAVYEGNVWLVNRRPLSLGYCHDDDVARYGADPQDVLSESSEGRRYPIMFRRAVRIAAKGDLSPVPKGYVLLADDTRLSDGFARLVPRDAVKGRVEGIIFSRRVRMIGSDACGGLKPTVE